MDPATVLIVSDDAEFSRALTGRWQSEPHIPTFTLMGSDLCQELDAEAFDLAIVGGVRRDAFVSILEALETTEKPVLLICEDSLNARDLRQAGPRFMQLQQQEGWLGAMVLVVSEALRRIAAVDRLRRAEEENALLQQQATLGNYMRDMLHNLNNALTSVLGNSELLLLEPGALSPTSVSQVETIRKMALRMHEILHRFASLEKELKMVATQAEDETRAKARSAGTR